MTRIILLLYRYICNAKACRIFSHVNTKISFVALALLMSSQGVAVAADMVIGISQHALNKAVSVVRAEGTYNYNSSIQYPCYSGCIWYLFLELLEEEEYTSPDWLHMDRQEATSDIEGFPRLEDSASNLSDSASNLPTIPDCEEVGMTTCFSPLPTRTWEWKVLSAAYEITATDGVRLKGLLRLQEQGGDSARYFPFNKPVNISFNSAASKLNLNVVNSEISETVLSLGEAIVVGPIDIGPFFSSSQPLFASFEPNSDTNVQVKAANVSVQTFNGELKVSADLVFY